MSTLETPPRRRNRTRLLWAVAAVAAVAIAAVAWRWAPRPVAVATEPMKQAVEKLIVSKPASEATPAPIPASNPKTDRGRLIAAAYSMKGIPYKWGAKGPDRYDCSGFTKAAYSKVGVKLPDGSFNQAKGEQALESVADMTPGDLILYRWAGSKGVKHVTMYAGDGWVIGTGTPGQPSEVTVYPLVADLVNDGRVITYRHIVLRDER